MNMFFERRRLRKAARHLLHQARVCRMTREDVAPPQALRRLEQCESLVAAGLEARDYDNLAAACEQLREAMRPVVPVRRCAWLAENFEVLVVAVAVAMAFRTYFLQPFKIPTGSMQPTLYGIHYEPRTKPGLLDRPPLKYAKWLLTGQWYCQFPARTTGVLRGPLAVQHGNGGTMLAFEIGGILHSVPQDLPLRCRPGAEVLAGQMLAEGVRITGDHVFVNKVKWNFLRPRRGEIIVFRTDNLPIPGLKEKTHYIKRLVGLPGESITIEEPCLKVNGRVPDSPPMLLRIQRQEWDRERRVRYAGYTLGPAATYLGTAGATMILGDGQYLALGDNSRNSLDGRYWGAVPRENLVGPALMVYWPLSRRWGLVQ